MDSFWLCYDNQQQLQIRICKVLVYKRMIQYEQGQLAPNKRQILQNNQQNAMHQNNSMIPTHEEQNNYQQVLQCWKTNQRNSLSKGQVEKYLPKFISSQNTPGKNRSFIDDKTSLIQKYSDQIIKYLKAKFVLEQLIEQMQRFRTIDMTDFNTVQFMHLVCFRAWCDIHSALAPWTNSKQQIKANKKNGQIQNQFVGSSNPEEQGIKILVIPMFKLCEKIEKVFELYHKCLSFKQKSFKYRIKFLVDFIFHNSKKTYRDKILYGVEGTDFSRQQQLKYTQDNLIPLMRKKLLEYQGKGPLQLRTLLLAYHRIMNIEFQKLESFDDFEVLKNTLIKQQDAKYKMKSALI